MPTQFIYFDLGNVLVLFCKDRQASQAAAVAGCSVELARQVLFDEQLEDRYERGELDDRTFHEEFCQRTQTTSDPDALSRAVSDIFELNSTIVPLVTQLSGANYPLGILSNTNTAHWDWVHRRYTLVRMFPRAVLSYEVGSMKPDPAIYRAAIAEAGVSPESIFFTDDRAENVAAAKQQGIDAVPFESASQIARELRARGLQFNY